MKSLNYAGSQWAKWDLHIHSNASDGKASPEQIIQEAKKKNISVIALTDHHTVKNIDKIKRLGEAEGIKVISGIEFRTEYGSKSVHMIGLFPDKYKEIQLNQTALEQLILGPLNLSEVLIKAKGKLEKPDADDEEAFKIGMFKVQVDFREAAKLIHQYGGLVSVHAGDKANSIEEMKHKGTSPRNVKDVVDSLGTVKEELLRDYIDICEVGGINDKNASFYTENFYKPAIIASDAHDVEHIGSLYTWIKGDRNLEGLRQIVYEPKQRVKIQFNLPEMKSDYQIIESIEINHSDFGKQTIPLNSNLNTIIGGRSSGKSILLGCIAKLANYTGTIKAGNDEYEKYISDITSSMRLKWRDATDGVTRKVEYFPQSYINNLASKSKETRQLIENILKGDEARKMIYENYDSENSQILVEISNEIENFFKLQYRLSAYKKELESIGDIKGVTSEINKLIKEINSVKSNSIIKISEEVEKKHISLKEEREKLLQLINKNNVAEKQLVMLSSVVIAKDITSDVIGLPEEIKNDILKEYSVLSGEISKKWKGILEEKKERLKKESLEAEKRINAIKVDQDYVKGETYYKENAAIEELNKRIDIEKIKADKISALCRNVKEIEDEVTKSKQKIFSKRQEYYRLGVHLCDYVSLEKDDVKITPMVKFNKTKFLVFIESNLNRRSSYVNTVLDYEYTNAQDFEVVLKELFENLIADNILLKGSRDKKQTIIEMLTNNYYMVGYDVIYQGDTLSSMSEGKKAFVILRMLLDFNGHECPILIDQPEDDLDNRAIYNDLVSYIRKKKVERQIILVTHNPNVVVAADAEEVIVANQHGIHNENQESVKFEYRTGAIENSYKCDEEKTILLSQGIREHVCDILEGGDLAFKQRENKYGFMLR